ncbi:MAG: sensor histidine kinase [Chitinophagaceae bacterium]|nr:sensor histidine kinase [Chitinophagaceae bacterium]
MLQNKEEIRLAIILGTLLFITLSLIITVSIVLYRSRQEKHRREKNKMQEQFFYNILQTQLEIQEQTLKNISQEIHDNVGQVLSLAKLNLNLAEVNNPEQAQSKINNALSQVSKAITDLRDLSKSFNTDNIIAQGLIKAIAAELDMIGRTGSHKTTFRITGASHQQEAQKELILFRIVQEALHNIIKHANAKSITVNAAYSNQLLELLVSDDGIGFDLTPLNENGNSQFGLGIRNMHNRAKLIGADFSMSSTIGKGSVVKIVLPYSPDQTINHGNY